MAKVTWSDQAIFQLLDIAEYIREFDPAAAEKMARRLKAAAEGLSSFPHRGRPAGGDRRELPSVQPYIIRYRVQDGDVVILDIRHYARRPDSQ